MRATLLMPLLLGLAQTFAAAQDPMPTLLEHKALKDPWTVGIQYSAINPGKVKIFDQMPSYDSNAKITTVPVAQLRNSKDHYTLLRTVRNYYLVFYPEKGLINLTVKLHKQGTPESSAATFNVKQAVVKDTAATPPVLSVSPMPKATFNAGAYERPEAGPFVVLD